VKGHQDDHKIFAELDQWSQANALVDKIAKRELRLNRQLVAGPLLEGQSWKLRCKGRPIAGNVEKQIRNTMRLMRTNMIAQKLSSVHARQKKKGKRFGTPNIMPESDQS